MRRRQHAAGRGRAWLGEEAVCRRADAEAGPQHSIVCYADPEMWATKGETKWGEPASDVTDYQELAIEGFVRSNNRRRAGRTRVAELLKPDPERYFPR